MGRRRALQRDIDIAVPGDALTTARELADALGGAYVLLNQEHQIARVVLDYQQRRWHVDLSTLQGDILQDLARRDLTINAMAAPLGAFTQEEVQVDIVDPWGGQRDLAQKTVRSLNDGIFRADPVRLLRAVRLAMELGFFIARETKDQMRKDAALLGQAPAERVRDEFCRMLSGEKADGCLRVLDQLGLLEVLLPELAPTKGVEQPKEHYWDVFNHSIETVKMVEVVLRAGRQGSSSILYEVPWSPTLSEYFLGEVSGGGSRRPPGKLAGLLHDIAKPQTKTLDADGRARFLGHPKLGAERSASILERLRFSARETHLVTTMVLQHLRPGLISGELPLPTQRAIYKYYRDTEDGGIDILYLSLADYLAARGPRLDPNDWRSFAGRVRYVLNQKLTEAPSVAPPKLITGNDVMRDLGLEPGPLIGQLLEGVREAQAAGEVNSREAARSRVRQLYVEFTAGVERGGNMPTLTCQGTAKE